MSERADLAERLEQMASHPMAMMEREWSDVSADLTAAAKRLREKPRPSCPSCGGTDMPYGLSAAYPNGEGSHPVIHCGCYYR